MVEYNLGSDHCVQAVLPIMWLLKPHDTFVDQILD